MSYLTAPSDRDYAAECGSAVNDDIDDALYCDFCGIGYASESDPLCPLCRAEADDAVKDAQPYRPDPIDTLYEYARDMGFEDELPF